MRYLTLMPLFDELRGERVVVRPYRESDAQALFEAVGESREHLRPWLPFADAHQTVEESRDWIIHQLAEWLLRRDMQAGIWERATNRYVGGSGLDPHNWETGYFEIIPTTGKPATSRLATGCGLRPLVTGILQRRCVS